METALLDFDGLLMAMSAEDHVSKARAYMAPVLYMPCRRSVPECLESSRHKSL